MSAVSERLPLDLGQGGEAVGEGAWLLRGQGHSIAVQTSEGLVMVDAGPGGAVTHGMIETLRGFTAAPLAAIAYSHGHLGYNAGVPQWLAHAAARGDPPPRLIAQAHCAQRYARYRETMGLQERLAEIQFRRPPGAMQGRLALHDATEWFDERLEIGGERGVVLMAAPSETDDALVLWRPADRLLFGGPAVIDSMPNIGTPLRTLRDTVRWADTLDRLAELAPATVVREFGATIRGAGEAQRVLRHTARALRWLRQEVVRLLNQGLGERELLDAVKPPAELFDVPWLKPTYGDASYIVRDLYRQENGWWDRNPTSLHPAPAQAAAAAVGAAIADKAAVLAAARAHAEAGDVQLALHVVDLLATAAGDAPEFDEARRLKAAWLRRRAAEVKSYVSRSLYLQSAEMLEQGTAGQRLGIR